MVEDAPDHATIVPTGSDDPPPPPDGASVNSKAFPAEFTFNHLLAVNEDGVSVNPINVDDPPPLPV